MAPTVPLSRAIFEPPTFYYKVGVAFLAWLNGFQPQFAMLGGLERRRPARHLIRVFELAAAARALTDPDLAVERMNELLARLVGPDGMTGFGLERLSLNQATVKYLGLADAVALCVRHDIPAIGLWRDRVAEAGLSSAAALVRRAGLHVSSLCRGGFFTRGRRRRAGGGAGGQPGRGARRRPRWGPMCWSWCAAGWCRGAGISGWPGAWWPTRSASWCRSRSGLGSGWGSSRCTRCSAPTGA